MISEVSFRCGTRYLLTHKNAVFVYHFDDFPPTNTQSFLDKGARCFWQGACSPLAVPYYHHWVFDFSFHRCFILCSNKKYKLDACWFTYIMKQISAQYERLQIFWPRILSQKNHLDLHMASAVKNMPSCLIQCPALAIPDDQNWCHGAINISVIPPWLFSS